MGDGVGFEEPWARFVPLVGFDGDMFSEEGSRFSGCPPPVFIVDSDGVQEAVNRSGRDAQEGLGGVWREMSKGFPITGEPEREDRFQTFGAGEVGRQPDLFERSKDELGVIDRRSPSFFRFGFCKPLKPPEQSDGMFSVISTGSTEFVQDDRLIFVRSLFVP
jgi:hypothetical protein